MVRKFSQAWDHAAAVLPSPHIPRVPPQKKLVDNRAAGEPPTTPVNRYENHTPKKPSSSSTILPKTYRKKMFPDRWAQLAWQKMDVTHCHHCGWRWLRYSDFINGR